MIPNNAWIPNPMLPNTGGRGTLGLNQVENFVPVQSFVDESNTSWNLVKAASNSTIDIPDPKSIQITDYWNHDFPGLKSKLYVYVVEGIKQPRVETEQPTRVLYQWFSTVFVPTFTPMMITEREWLRANVYAAPVVNARVSKLNAICKLGDSYGAVDGKSEDKLLKVEELTSGSSGRNQEKVGDREANTGRIVQSSQASRDDGVHDEKD